MGKTIVEPDISKLNDFLAKSLEEMVAEYLSLNTQERKDLLNALSKRSHSLAEPSFTSWKLHRQHLRFLEQEKDHTWKDLLALGKLADYLQTFVNEEMAIAAAQRGKSPAEYDPIVDKVKAEWHVARKMIMWSADIPSFLKSDIEGMLAHIKNGFAEKRSRLVWRDAVNRYIKENNLWPADTWNTLSEAYDFVEEVIKDPQYGKKTWLYEYLKHCKVYADLRQKCDVLERELKILLGQTDEINIYKQEVERLKLEVKTLEDGIGRHKKTIAEQAEKISRLQAYAPIVIKPLDDGERVKLYEAYQGHYLRSVDR